MLCKLSSLYCYNDSFLFNNNGNGYYCYNDSFLFNNNGTLLYYAYFIGLLVLRTTVCDFIKQNCFSI